MSNAGNNGTRKNNSAKSVMTAKKPRTVAQQRANQAQKEKGQEVQAWLESHGLKKGVIYGAKYKAMKKQGKSDEEIVAFLREMQGVNNAAKAVKTAAKTAKKANNAQSVASGVSKRNISTQRQRNLAKKFANAGLKWVGPAQTTFKQLKTQLNNAGNPMNDDAVINKMKADHPEFAKNAAPIPRTKRTVAIPVATNVDVPKGHYICEKCHLVANAPVKTSVNSPASVVKTSVNSPASVVKNNNTSVEEIVPVERSLNVEELE